MNKRIEKIAIVIIAIAAFVLIWSPACKREPSPARLLAVPTPEPLCIPCGTDPATGAQAICCKRDVSPHLFIDAEMRDGGAVLENLVTETFISATITPTTRITVTLALSDFTYVGDLWLRARWAYDPLDAGIIGTVLKDGQALPMDENGYAYYGEIYRRYLPVVIAVVQ